MPTLHSHAHLQAAQATTQTKLAKEYACPIAPLTDNHTTEKNNEGITKPKK